MDKRERERGTLSHDDRPRYVVSTAAGQRDGKRFVVLDRFDHQGGKGMRRASFHSSFKEAKREAKRLNGQGK